METKPKIKLFRQVWFYLLLCCFVGFFMKVFLVCGAFALDAGLKNMVSAATFANCEERWLSVSDDLLALGVFYLPLAAFVVSLFCTVGALLNRHASWRLRWLSAGRYLLLGFILIVGILMEPPPRREGTRRLWCSTNLKQIYICLEQYRETEGAFPPDWATFITWERDDFIRELLICPSHEGESPREGDYLYFPPTEKECGETGTKVVPLLMDAPGNHPGNFRNVLYSSGIVAGEKAFP